LRFDTGGGMWGEGWFGGRTFPLLLGPSVPSRPPPPRNMLDTRSVALFFRLT